MLSKAIEENKINIKAPISEYLDLGKDKYYPTIERLITHTSGYKSYYLNKQMVSNHFLQNNDFYGINKNEILNRVKAIKLKAAKVAAGAIISNIENLAQWRHK